MSGFCRTKHHTHVRHTSTEVWKTTLIKKFLLLTTMTHHDQNFIQFFTTMSPQRPVKKNTHGFIRFSLFFALKTAGFFLPRQDTLKLSRYNIIRYNDHVFLTVTKHRPVFPGVLHPCTFLTRWNKNHVKNTEKLSAVFNTTKRKKRIRPCTFLTGR
jgi:hypothetical protein